jgi:ABC-type multidrug transport system fused ATPase/permease subunit
MQRRRETAHSHSHAYITLPRLRSLPASFSLTQLLSCPCTAYHIILFHSLPLHKTNRLLTSGSNLSQGQRQLVSLARALLTPSNILVLDEATAAVDVETDALLQNTLRSPLFSKRTIITIAHRINTILDSDRIVVLEQGRVVEFDSPKTLVERKGLFYKLVKEAGLVDGVR